jgi:hypothetical protein
VKNGAFVFTTMAFLLVIPAIILAASFIEMTRIGDDATTTAMRADNVFFAFNSIRSSFEETSKNLVDVYENDSNKIRTELNSTWAPFIEQEYTEKIGVNTSIPEEDINVTYNNATNSISIGNINNINEGITISVFDSRVNMTSEIGPLKISVS